MARKRASAVLVAAALLALAGCTTTSDSSVTNPPSVGSAAATQSATGSVSSKATAGRSSGTAAAASEVPATVEATATGDVAPAGEVAATGGATPKDVERAPTSTDLIAAALASGDIEEPTALLYRVWALFTDPALPAEYQGASSPTDSELFAELEASLAGLPSEVRARIEPYLRRPSDPASAFRATPDGSPPGLHSARWQSPQRQSPQRQSPQRHSPPEHRPSPQVTGRTDAASRCTTDWVFQEVTSAPATSTANEDLPFRVWACPDAGAVGERTTAEAMAAVVEILAAHAGDMIADMGRPVPDDPWSDPNTRADGKIDVYVLPPGWFAPYRDEDFAELPAGFRAVTITAEKRRGVTASGYVLVGASLLEQPERLAASVVHEVFHVLQYSHNAELSARWFNEASAVWASAYYLPEIAANIAGVQLPILQTSPLAVHAEQPAEHPYAAYLWPLFMQQQAGPASIFATYRDLASAPAGADSDDVIAAIGRQLDVSASFAEFAMRLLNADLPGDPIRTRFVRLDPTFPDGTTPPLSPLRLDDKPLTLDHTGVPGLGYRYSSVDVAVPEGAETRVRISGDLATAAGGRATVEALVRGGDGHYRRQAIDVAGDGTDVCVAGRLLLVVSNPATDIRQTLAGKVVLERADDLEPGCGLTGELTVTFDADYRSPPDQWPVPQQGRAHWTGKLALALGSLTPSEFSAEPGFYPNRGSHWTMSGDYEFERCVGPRKDPCIGAALIAQSFAADETIAAEAVNSDEPVTPDEPSASADPEGRPQEWPDNQPDRLRIDVTAEGPVLRAMVPVTVTTTAYAPNLGVETSTDTMLWPLSCPTDGQFWQASQIDDRFSPPDGEDPTGTWNDERTELTFDCQNSWPVRTYDEGSGETGSVRISLTGTLRSD